MITRGYYIGQIIDEFTAISNQVKTRACLHLFDLNIFLEDFCKDVLNIILDSKLTNLNEERSNNPGLDLGDLGGSNRESMAFQITSTKSSKKINETLEKSLLRKDDFKNIYVLILQSKQGQYTLNAENCKTLNFTSENNIWDFDDLLKKIMSLDIEKLKRLFEYVNSSVARVKIELEIPDENGNYQTDIAAFIEEIPKERFEGVATYHAYLQKQGSCQASILEVETDFKNFISRLKKLPRITRDFYAFLLERGESDGNTPYFKFDCLKRVCNLRDIQGEIRILRDQNFCVIEESSNQEEGSVLYALTVSGGKCPNFSLDFLDFIKANGISLKKVIVSLDFVDFK